MNAYEHDELHRQRDARDAPGCFGVIVMIILMVAVVWVAAALVMWGQQSADCRLYAVEHPTAETRLTHIDGLSVLRITQCYVRPAGAVQWETRTLP